MLKLLGKHKFEIIYYLHKVNEIKGLFIIRFGYKIVNSL